MPAKSKVTSLPPEMKAWLDAELVRRGFQDYVQLAADLKAKGEDVSKSALHRYGSKFEERMAILRITTEQARAVVAASPDDEGAMNEALIRLTQDTLFGILVDLKVDPKKVDVTKLTRAVAELARGSVTQKKWQTEVRSRAAAVADQIGKEAKRMGASDEVIQTWREKVLGVASK